MPTCSAVGCPNGGRNGRKGVLKYPFPDDEDLVNIWKERIGIVDPDWQPKKTSSVCADHFCEVIVFVCHSAYISNKKSFFDSI